MFIVYFCCPFRIYFLFSINLCLWEKNCFFHAHACKWNIFCSAIDPSQVYGQLPHHVPLTFWGGVSREENIYKMGAISLPIYPIPNSLKWYRRWDNKSLVIMEWSNWIYITKITSIFYFYKNSSLLDNHWCFLKNHEKSTSTTNKMKVLGLIFLLRLQHKSSCVWNDQNVNWKFQQKRKNGQNWRINLTKIIDGILILLQYN